MFPVAANAFARSRYGPLQAVGLVGGHGLSGIGIALSKAALTASLTLVSSFVTASSYATLSFSYAVFNVVYSSNSAFF